MLIVNASAPKGPEIAMQRHLRSMAGVLIGNGEVPRSNGMTRETDGIVLTPSRVFVVEAKGFIGETPNSGLLEPALNGDWIIGGQVAKFYGNEWPNVQARQSAQTLAGVLREQTTVKAFVTGIASISAKNALMPDGPVQLGEVMVCKDHDLLDAVAAMPMLGRNKPITVDHVFEVLKALLLPERMWPTRADVEAEWAKALQQAPVSPTSAPVASGGGGEARHGGEPTFKQIMADAKARRGGKTAQEQTAEVLGKLGVRADGRTVYSHQPLPASTSAPTSEHTAEPDRLEVESARLGKGFGSRLMALVALAAVIYVGVIVANKVQVVNAEDEFRAAAVLAYPEAEDYLQDNLKCVDFDGMMQCGVNVDGPGKRYYRLSVSTDAGFRPEYIKRTSAPMGKTSMAEDLAAQWFDDEFMPEHYPEAAERADADTLGCSKTGGTNWFGGSDNTYHCSVRDTSNPDKPVDYLATIQGEPGNFTVEGHTDMPVPGKR